MKQFGNAAASRLDLNGFSEKIIIAALKAEKSLELWGEFPDIGSRLIKRDRIVAAGGGSVGCITVSDSDIEEIFYLAAKVGA